MDISLGDDKRDEKSLAIQAGKSREDRVVANLPENNELVKLLYIQMHVCQKSLDAFGFDLSAAHLDASINALRHEIQGAAVQSKMDQTLVQEFSDIDAFISQTLIVPPMRDLRAD